MDSPSFRALIDRFTRAYRNVTHLSVAPAAVPGEERVTPGIDWEKTDVVLSLGADFLGGAGSIADKAGFASRRNPEAAGGMNRLWVAEGAMTLTGCNADHRIRVRPSKLTKLAHALVGELASAHGLPSASSMAMPSPAEVAGEIGVEVTVLRTLAKDLAEHPGRAIVFAGKGAPESVRAAVAHLNGQLSAPVSASSGVHLPAVSSWEEVEAVVRDLNSGQVAVAIDLGANPAYAIPPAAGFSDALAKAGLVVSSSLSADETSVLARIVIPASHDLESWGDSDRHSGSVLARQPVIRPLMQFDSRQIEESLLRWLPEPPFATYREFVMDRWEREVYAAVRPVSSFMEFWQTALHDGFVSVETVRPAGQASSTSSNAAGSGCDLLVLPSPSTYDGRFADSGWLQEKPHPVTTQVWGNGAVISAATATRLGLSEGDAVRIDVAGRALTLPALVEPGTADDTVVIDMGYGRSAAGPVGTDVGANVLALMGHGGLSNWLYTGATLEKAGGSVDVIRLQEHNNMHGRHLVVEGSSEHYAEHPEFVTELLEQPAVPSPGGWLYATGHKWEMAIDLSACIGCGACQTACMSENNIPVVGPEQVARGREMHWIRIDRYYSDDEDNPQGAFQPMMCQHCDNAPCENVCPVAATAHSPEGLNEMAYNRCVGTRYCANNCPYKVRRFNFFNYFDEGRIGATESPNELRFNPEVTVRSRGVMEKCTFCTQRIASARQTAKVEGRPMRDGEAVPACAQACPTKAITFGDINNPDSRVGMKTAIPRGYNVLGEVGTSPGITYLAKIRNPHADLA